MGAVTFPDAKVIAFIKQNVIPIRLPHDHKPLAEQFQVKWTPALVTLDMEGKEHHRTVGFLSPEELIPSLLLGKAKIDFDHEDFGKALTTLEDLLKDPRFPVIRRHLRKMYPNPLDPEGKWEFVLDGTGRIKGVFANRKEKPLKVKQFAEDYSDFENAKTYSDWKFVFGPGVAVSNSAVPEEVGGEEEE